MTIGGWIVSYIVQVRNGTSPPPFLLCELTWVSRLLSSSDPLAVLDHSGGPSAGYTSSGFFGGLTVGRIIFIPLTKRLGENLSIYVYTLAALALELVVWFVPSLVGNAVAVSFVGVFIGPHYPIVVSAVTKVIPRSHAGGAIGWIGPSFLLLLSFSLLLYPSFPRSFSRVDRMGFFSARLRACSLVRPSRLRRLPLHRRRHRPEAWPRGSVPSVASPF